MRPGKTSEYAAQRRLEIDRMSATEVVLGWLRCGPKTPEDICARSGSVRLETVRKTLAHLEAAGTVAPDGGVYTLINDPEHWRGIRWMVGQPQLRTSEHYGAKYANNAH